MRRGRRRWPAAAATVGCLLALVLVDALAGAVPGTSHPIALPVPHAWGWPPLVRYETISCTAIGTCATIGTFSKNPPSQKPAVDDQRDGAWVNPHEIPLPRGAAASSGGFRSIACPTSGSCVAVGAYTTTSNQLLPLVARESNDVWGTATSHVPLPAGSSDAELVAVSCWGVGECAVVGLAGTGTSSPDHLFVDEQRSGRWGTSTTLPTPRSSRLKHPGAVSPSGLSCAAHDACVVVGGISGRGLSELGFVEVQHASRWRARVIAPTSAIVSVLTAVDCPTPSTCVAVGITSGHSLYSGLAPLAASDASGRWTVQVPAWRFSAPSTQQGSLFGVSCGSSTQCVAVGNLIGGTGSSSGDIPVAYTWTSGHWSGPAIARTPAAFHSVADGSLLGVSCPTPVACEAIGSATTRSEGGDVPFSTVIEPHSTGGVPGAPTSVRVTAASGIFNVTWKGPTTFGGSPIVAYVVVARSSGEPTVSCASETLTCTLAGIAAHRTYTVDVAAWNVAGRKGRTATRTATGG